MKKKNLLPLNKQWESNYDYKVELSVPETNCKEMQGPPQGKAGSSLG